MTSKNCAWLLTVTLLLLCGSLASCVRETSESGPGVGTSNPQPEQTAETASNTESPVVEPTDVRDADPIAPDDTPEPSEDMFVPEDFPDTDDSATGEESTDDAADADDSGNPPRTPDVIFVPTPQAVVERMLEMAQVTADDVVYDLGCGDGRIVVTAARKFGCKAIGIDIDPERIKEAKQNVAENGVEALVTIEQGDIFQRDLSGASVVTLYLLPELNVRLIPQLKQLQPGSRIVSHAFRMRGVTPDSEESVETEEGTTHSVYLWTTPLKVDESEQDDWYDF